MDFQRRIKHIVQCFHLSPLKLRIPQLIRKQLISQVLSQINEPIKQIDIKIAKNHKIILYRDRLYVCQKIIFTKEPASNFEQNRFNVNVFSENGDILCSFHNYKSSQYLAKSIDKKFRNVEFLYFVEILQKPNADLEFFIEVKKTFQQLNPSIKLIGIYFDQSIPKQYIPNLKHKLNKKQINDQQLIRFCADNSIRLLRDNNQKKQYGNQNFNQYTKLVNHVLRKKVFDNSILKFACFKDQKLVEYRKRNQIVNRLINYFFQQIPIKSEINIFKSQQVQQFFSQLIPQILDQKIRYQQLQHLKKQTNQIHLLEIINSSPRICLKCKLDRTKFICKGCSLKYSIEVRLCQVGCFTQFHNHDYFNNEALSLLRNKSRKSSLPKFSFKKIRRILPFGEKNCKQIQQAKSESGKRSQQNIQLEQASQHVEKEDIFEKSNQIQFFFCEQQMENEKNHQ